MTASPTPEELRLLRGLYTLAKEQQALGLAIEGQPVPSDLPSMLSAMGSMMRQAETLKKRVDAVLADLDRYYNLGDA